MKKWRKWCENLTRESLRKKFKFCSRVSDCSQSGTETLTCVRNVWKTVQAIEEELCSNDADTLLVATEPESRKQKKYIIFFDYLLVDPDDVKFKLQDNWCLCNWRNSTDRQTQQTGVHMASDKVYHTHTHTHTHSPWSLAVDQRSVWRSLPETDWSCPDTCSHTVDILSLHIRPLVGETDNNGGMKVQKDKEECNFVQCLLLKWTMSQCLHLSDGPAWLSILDRWCKHKEEGRRTWGRWNITDLTTESDTLFLWTWISSGIQPFLVAVGLLSHLGVQDGDALVRVGFSSWIPRWSQ